MGPASKAEQRGALADLYRATAGLADMVGPGPIIIDPYAGRLGDLARELDQAQLWLFEYLVRYYPHYNAIMLGPGQEHLSGLSFCGLPCLSLPANAMVPVIWPHDIYEWAKGVGGE